MNCSTCKSWKRTGTTTTGQCRLRAPAIGFVTLTEHQLAPLPAKFWWSRLLAFLGLRAPQIIAQTKVERCTSFPITEADAACGDYQRKA